MRMLIRLRPHLRPYHTDWSLLAFAGMCVKGAMRFSAISSLSISGAKTPSAEDKLWSIENVSPLIFSTPRYIFLSTGVKWSCGFNERIGILKFEQEDNEMTGIKQSFPKWSRLPYLLQKSFRHGFDFRRCQLQSIRMKAVKFVQADSTQPLLVGTSSLINSLFLFMTHSTTCIRSLRVTVSAIPEVVFLR